MKHIEHSREMKYSLIVNVVHMTCLMVIALSLQHVLDCTAPNLEEHRSTVLHVLEQIGVSKEKLENMIEVWNKVLVLFPLYTFRT